MKRYIVVTNIFLHMGFDPKYSFIKDKEKK